MIPGSYSPFLVLASVCIAVLASYAALDLAARVTAARGRFVPAWLAGGATAMGIGIWSMHFTGMAAFSLPIPVMYHWPTAVEIEDRGHGFDPDAVLAASSTIGLSDMRERAMLLGGRLTIESSPGSVSGRLRRGGGLPEVSGSVPLAGWVHLSAMRARKSV